MDGVRDGRNLMENDERIVRSPLESEDHATHTPDEVRWTVFPDDVLIVAYQRTGDEAI